MGWGDRSRSPKKKNDNLAWISKKLAVLGRYSDRRPHGLHVDGNGTLSLSNLMEAWGNSQGITEDDVLNAVRTNMTCERTGRPRFALAGNSHTGEWTITVHQSGGGWGDASGGSAAKENDWYSQNSKTYQDKNSYNSYDRKNGSSIYSDDWQQTSQSQSWQSTNSSPGWRYQHQQSEEKTSSAQTNDRWSSQTSTASQQGSWGNKAKAWRLQSSWQGKGEQITRFLGWMLKNAWKEDLVQVDNEGWAQLEDCVAAMQIKKPEFGIETTDDLKQTLKSEDTEGRFAVDEWGSRVRKVDRADRQPPAEPANPPSSRPSQAAWSQQRKTSAPFNAFAAKAEPEEEKPPQAWMKEEQVDWGNAADEDDDGQDAAPGAGKNRPPKLPPGKHWEMYDDNGVSWWYYEGPRGKWWMQDGQTPQPWDDGDVPAEEF